MSGFMGSASDVLAACARATYEAELAVDLARDVDPERHRQDWDRTSEEARREQRRRVAIVLDLQAESKGVAEEIPQLELELMKQLKITRSRANLLLSVVAAIYCTLDDEG